MVWVIRVHLSPVLARVRVLLCSRRRVWVQAVEVQQSLDHREHLTRHAIAQIRQKPVVAAIRFWATQAGMPSAPHPLSKAASEQRGLTPRSAARGDGSAFTITATNGSPHSGDPVAADDVSMLVCSALASCFRGKKVV